MRALALVLTALACGCVTGASSGGKTASLVETDRQVREQRRSDPAAYRRAVNERASRRGVRVIWLNPPRAKELPPDAAAEMTPPTDPFRYHPSLLR